MFVLCTPEPHLLAPISEEGVSTGGSKGCVREVGVRGCRERGYRVMDLVEYG